MKKLFYGATIISLLLFSATVLAQENSPETTMRYVTNEVIVKFKPNKINLQKATGLQSMRSFASREALTTENIIADENISVMKINDGQTVDDTIQDLQNDTNVEYVQPNFIYEIQIENPNDTYFAGEQRGLKNIGQVIGVITGTIGADIQRNEAMDIRSGNSNPNTTGTLVAVIDDGLRYTHPEFSGQLRDGTNCLSDTGATLGGCIYGYDFLDTGISPLPQGSDTHGTHVAGIIGAKVNNGTGIAGINPGAKIMMVRAGDDDNGLNSRDIIEAIHFAKYNGAKIINASRGGITESCNDTWGYWDRLMYEAIDEFPGLFIAAAGNGDDHGVGQEHLNNRYMTPADYNTNTSCRSGLDNIITVAASTNKDQKASFSDYGPNIDIAAPGRYIASTTYTGLYEERNGTSMATPFVAAVASLARSMRPDLSYLDIKSAIIDQAEYVAALNGFVKNGKRLNAFLTLRSQVQIAGLQTYIGSGVGVSFISGASISGTQAYFQRLAPYYTGTVSGYQMSITHDGSNYLETGTVTTGTTIVLLSGNGTYLFAVWPIMIGGATGNTLSTTFILDNTAPEEITGTLPVNNQILGYQQLQFTRSQTNETGSRYRYEIYLSGSDIPVISGSTTATGIMLPDTITNGTYHRQVRPQDLAGNTGSRSELGTFIYNKPSAFSFTAQTSKELSQSYSSDEITITGLITGAQVSIIGGTYSISGQTWTGSTGIIFSGDLIKIQLTSSSSYSTTTTATLTIGGLTGSFSITTKSAPSGGPTGGPSGIPTCKSNDLICTSNGYILETGANCQGGNLGKSCTLTTTGSTGNMINTGPQMIFFEHLSDQQRIIGSPFSTEINTAYLYAYDIGITTAPTILQANLTGTLIRKHLAKMISNFAIKELKKIPNTGMICNFTDMIQETAEMKLYGKLACQLGLMGLDTNGNPTKNFNPDDEVTRAQFGSVLSRALRGNSYNGGEPYYTLHLNALQEVGIMTQIDTPENQELRGRVMLMLMRADQ